MFRYCMDVVMCRVVVVVLLLLLLLLLLLSSLFSLRVGAPSSATVL